VRSSRQNNKILVSKKLLINKHRLITMIAAVKLFVVFVLKKENSHLITSPYSSHFILSSVYGNIGYDFLACLQKT
jgi:hypothetical protein